MRNLGLLLIASTLVFSGCFGEAKPPSHRNGPTSSGDEGSTPPSQPDPTPIKKPDNPPASTPNPPPAPETVSLNGTWKSGCIGWDSNGSWIERITINGGSFQVITDTFDGKACESFTEQVRYTISGGIAIGREISTPQGTANIITMFDDTITAMPLSFYWANQLNGAQYCGFGDWNVDVTKYISGQVCNGVVEPFAGQATYNILQIRGTPAVGYYIQMGYLPSSDPNNVPGELYPVSFYRQ